MSLLMDALKRAEASKQAGLNEAQESSALSLEPLATTPGNAANVAATASVSTPASASTSAFATASTAPSGASGNQSLPDLALHIAAVDADLAASAAQPSPPPVEKKSAPAKVDHGVTAARTMFAAKTAAPPASRKTLWWLVGGLLVAGIAIGAYFWFQLQQIATPPLRPALAQAPHPAPSPAVPPAVAPTQATTPTTAPDFASIERAAKANAMAQQRERTAAPQAAAERESATSPIRISRTQPEPDQNIARGWINLRAGALDAASLDYQKTLKTDPKNVDALLGLASIAQRQGRNADASRLQQLAGESDPKDATAQSALIAQSAASDPQGTESRLKNLLASQPESPTLNFALGNLYARQKRWSEAQAAFFNAVSGDAGNPDYLFNLAVALDHLRQPKLAIQHYQQALNAASNRSPSFDQNSVRQRLGQLQESARP